MQPAGDPTFSLAYFLLEESGASLSEYVLLASLIFVVCKLVLLALNKGF